jgi:hypothetical protein
VARTLTLAELEKAAGNLETIEAYLAPRAGWEADRASLEAIASMQRSIRQMARRVGGWRATSEPQVRDRAAPPPEQLAQDALDSGKLSGFATFLERLAQWFEASGATPPGGEGAAAVDRLVRSLDHVDQALAAIAGSPPLTRAATAAASLPLPAAPAPVSVERSAGPSPVVDDVFAGAPRQEPHTQPAPAEQIALTAADADPMFRWVGSEEIELTERARDCIERLFNEQGVTFFRYQLENFVEEVRRRIKSAPEGHVLVIKVRDIGGDRKPFLSYVSETTLKGQ